MNATQLKGAVANGAARIRRLANGGVFISVPDAETAVLLMNPTGRPIFDFSKCKRMSRGAAHRVVDAMDDAGPELKMYYHGLINAKPEAKE